MRAIQKAISSIPNHYGIGVKMTSQNIFFSLGLWVELLQILRLGFSVYSNLLVVRKRRGTGTPVTQSGAEQSEGTAQRSAFIWRLLRGRAPRQVKGAHS